MHNPHHKLGESRSSYKHDHLLQTPDTFVQAPLPGMTKATAIVHAAPAIGADFTQYTAILKNDGTLGPAFPSASRFVFVLDGKIILSIEKQKYTLKTNGFAVIPPNLGHTITSKGASRLAVIEKKYVAQENTPSPKLVIGSEDDIKSTPLLDDKDIQVRPLVPADAAWDFAVNTMTYAPGASLSMTEVHVMEHGLLMLAGGGIYKLGDHWYPVTVGDFIWMASYCPQWFGALGKTPAKYLIYKDWNRHPLAGDLR